ncbi:hypothetical protein BT93_B1883 [Corymbia citriodora subsp. variegata]|nr:hypothetical protein BT93_B1883 [Corymbia citriodora subsp. variegata]
MKGERTVKRASFGHAVARKALSDITNSPLQAKFPCDDGKQQQLRLSPATKDYVNQLLEEKMALIKVIEERNKMIELSGAELQKLRISYQKVQLQNWNLAQTNSQMLAELQSGREKIRILQHELVCKDAVIKAKNLELQGKGEVNRQKKGSKIKEEEEKEATESLPKPDDRAKPSNRDRKRGQKSRCTVSDGIQQDSNPKSQNLQKTCLRSKLLSFPLASPLTTRKIRKLLQPHSLPPPAMGKIGKMIVPQKSKKSHLENLHMADPHAEQPRRSNPTKKSPST